MAIQGPFNFHQWIEEHQEELQPPVSNETIYKGNDDFIVMVSGGPNTRKDFHYNESEELFYQVRGDINVTIVDEGQFRDIPIKEGEMFLCPPKVLHSPQRYEDTVGLIIEKHREPGDRDGFVYFCDNCGHQLYEEYFFLEDIVKQFPIVMNNFYSSLERRTCDHCGHVMALPPNWENNFEQVKADNPYVRGD
jgi:3-hydroxyanthranilate 3,4-dioxygenase